MTYFHLGIYDIWINCRYGEDDACFNNVASEFQNYSIGGILLAGKKCEIRAHGLNNVLFDLGLTKSDGRI